MEITLVVAGLIVAVVAGATGLVQVTNWVWQRGYDAGRSDAGHEAERADVQPRRAWRKSSWSASNGSCVAVAALGRLIVVRDTKDGGGLGLILLFGDAAWRAFVDGVKDGG